MYSVKVVSEVEMDTANLKKACEVYPEIYAGAGFYYLAVEIVDTYPIQASVILLATWNVGRVRFTGIDLCMHLTRR